jgi:hypothetical protein
MIAVAKLPSAKAVSKVGFAPLFAALAAMLSADAGALPLLGRDTGQSCAACHAGSRATDKIGEFVAGLSVNRDRGALYKGAPSYVPLAALMVGGPASLPAASSRSADAEYVFWKKSVDGQRLLDGVYRPAYGGSLGFYNRGGSDARALTVEGFWLPQQHLRVGAQYTLFNRNEALSDSSYEGAWRRDPGTLFLYLWRAY